MRTGLRARLLAGVTVVVALATVTIPTSTPVAGAATVPSCNVQSFSSTASSSTRPGGTTVRLVLTSHFFPTCDWSYATRYQFFSSGKAAIGAPLSLRSSPTVAIPVRPWPVNDTFQVVQELVTEEGVQCSQVSASFVGVTGADAKRVLVALHPPVGVCVSGTAKWTTLLSIAFPRPSACVARQLKVSMGRANGAAGTTYYPLVLSNRSGTACQVSGTPLVQPTSLNHVAVGPAASLNNRSSSGYGDPVRLAPGDEVSAAWGVGTAGDYAPAQCHPAGFAGVEVTLTGVGHWWIRQTGTTCLLRAITSVAGIVPGATGTVP